MPRRGLIDGHDPLGDLKGVTDATATGRLFRLFAGKL